MKKEKLIVPSKRQGKNTFERGAALVDYGILVGLISVVSIVAVGQLGAKVSDIFDGASTEVAQATAGNAAPGVAAVPDHEVQILYDPLDFGSPLQTAGVRDYLFINTSSTGFTTSNGSAHHGNSGWPRESGLAWLEIPQGAMKWPGHYRVDLVVGNNNSQPFPSAGAEVGLHNAAGFLTPLSVTAPVPASGMTENWSMTFDVSQSQIDNGLTLGIDVPYTGTKGNASFDDIKLTFVP